VKLRSLAVLALALTCATALPAICEAQQQNTLQNLQATGPTDLLIFYRVAPASRPAFRKIMQTDGVARLRHFQEEGHIAKSNIYFSRYADSDSWDMVLVLHFNSYADISWWNHVETGAPGGLPAAALALTTEISTYPVDVIASHTSETRMDTDPHVILVVPYQVVIPLPEYERYATGYVQPQLEGWMNAGILSDYRLTLGRGAAGKPYSAVLLLEYKDDASFGLRDRVLAETRQRLAANAEWKAFADTKQTIRTEKPAIIADELR
jgi:hypothetical protein